MGMKTVLQQQKFQFLPFVISLIITLAIAAVASLFTIPQIPHWYSTLNKPSFNPPNQLFGPVWAVLYIMIATSAYLVWQKRDGSAMYHNARLVYFVQLLLNFSWSIIFFGLHQILIALVVIVLLWISIMVTMAYFIKFRRAAFWLLLPYLLWVSFAGVLNFAIYLLNH
jgi:benzodiazapine receptor